MFWAIILMVLNFGISWFNAWQVGRSWNDSKVVGGFPRLVVWSAAVMSACGFTWVYLFGLTLLALATEQIDPEYAQGAIELGYIMIIIPLLGSGLVLTVHSWIVAVRERNLSSFGTAAWNTYAQIHNISGAASEVGGILDHLGSLLDSDSGSSSSSGSKGKKGGLLMVLLVIFALSAGILTTIWIVTSTARKLADELELDARRQQDLAA